MPETVTSISLYSSTLKQLKRPIPNTTTITPKKAHTYIIAIRLLVFSFGSELLFESTSCLSFSAIYSQFYCKNTQIFLNLSYLYQNNFYMPNLFRL